MTTAQFFGLFASGCLQGLVIGFAALALSLVFAVARFPNAATGDMMTLGAYAGLGVQEAGIRSYLVQGGAAIAACVVLGIAYYLLVFRFIRNRGLVSLLLASMGLALLTRSGIGYFFGQTQHVFNVQIVKPFVIAGVRLQWIDVWLAAASLVAMSAVFLVLFATPIGRRMRAVADDAALARVSGLRDDQIMLTMWSMVGAVTAVGGLILGIKTVVTPELGWTILLPAFAAAVVGGVGSPVGAVLAGTLLGIAQELSTPWLGFTYKIALSYVVLAAILAVRPRGLFGIREVFR